MLVTPPLLCSITAVNRSHPAYTGFAGMQVAGVAAGAGNGSAAAGGSSGGGRGGSGSGSGSGSGKVQARRLGVGVRGCLLQFPTPRSMQQMVLAAAFFQPTPAQTTSCYHAPSSLHPAPTVTPLLLLN